MLGSLNEDTVFFFQGFLGGADLAAASMVCHEFARAAHQAAHASFFDNFGAAPPGEATRLQLFQLVDRATSDVDAVMRDVMCWSAARGYVKMLRTLLARAHACVLDAKVSSSGATPLILAAEAGHARAVEVLLAAGADATLLSSAGVGASHAAAKAGHVDVMELLVQHDPALASLASSDGHTPLMFAAQGGRTDVMFMLIAACVDVNAITPFHDDQGGETALHLAAYRGFVAGVRMLLRAGANPNLQLRNGRTPLLLACEMGWLEVCRIMLTTSFLFPVDLSLATDSGKNPLYIAVEKNHEQLAALLVQAGCDATQSTRRNKTPLYAAVETGNVSIARLVLEAADTSGSDAFARTKFGTTPMFVAARTSNKAMQALLMEYASGAQRRKPPPPQRDEGTAPVARGRRPTRGSAEAPVASSSPTNLHAASTPRNSTSPVDARAASPAADVRPAVAEEHDAIPRAVLDAATAAVTRDELQRQRDERRGRLTAIREATIASRVEAPIFAEDLDRSRRRALGLHTYADESARADGTFSNAGMGDDVPAAGARRTRSMGPRAGGRGAVPAGDSAAPTDGAPRFTVMHGPPRPVAGGTDGPRHAGGGRVAGAAEPGGASLATAGGGGAAGAAGPASDAPAAPPPPMEMSEPAGNTLAEVMIRERQRREREEVEERLRTEEMERLHRARAVEMAERAKRRADEKAAVERAAAAAADAEERRKKAAEEKRRREAAVKAAAAFAKRAAEREARERAYMETLSLPRASATKPMALPLDALPAGGTPHGDALASERGAQLRSALEVPSSSASTSVDDSSAAGSALAAARAKRKGTLSAARVREPALAVAGPAPEAGADVLSPRASVSADAARELARRALLPVDGASLEGSKRTLTAANIVAPPAGVPSVIVTKLPPVADAVRVSVLSGRAPPPARAVVSLSSAVLDFGLPASLPLPAPTGASASHVRRKP